MPNSARLVNPNVGYPAVNYHSHGEWPMLKIKLTNKKTRDCSLRSFLVYWCWRIIPTHCHEIPAARQDLFAYCEAANFREVPNLSLTYLYMYFMVLQTSYIQYCTCALYIGITNKYCNHVLLSSLSSSVNYQKPSNGPHRPASTFVHVGRGVG